MLKALNKATYVLKGSYAFNIINDDYPDTIFGIRKDSPLIVGTSNEGNILASDIPAIIHVTNKYIILNNYDIVVLTKDNIKYYDRDLNEIHKDIKIFNGDSEEISKNGYDHYMLKEINEEGEVVKRILSLYTKDNKVGDIFSIKKYKSIDIVACGSAAFAGYIGKYYIEKYGVEKDIEKSISDEKEREIVLQKVSELSFMYMDVIDRISNVNSERMDNIEKYQDKLDEKIGKIKETVDLIKKDIYEDEDYDFEIVCPYCNHEFVADIEDELKEEIECPECHNKIELDWDGEDDDCCSGGCCGCGHHHECGSDEEDSDTDSEEKDNNDDDM